MYKQYLKQAFQLLKENKLFSIISITGTALAIAMIMVIVLTLRVETANFLPENKRDRTLYVKWMSTYWDNNISRSSNGAMSVRTGKECFKNLTTPEAVCLISMRDNFLASAVEGNVVSADVIQTDDAFWKIYDLAFISGKPFDKADFESGIPKAVITEDIARKLFNTSDATGQTIRLNYASYTVAGVVKDVSKLASTAYAQVWIPYTSTELPRYSWANDVMGSFKAVILAHSKDDFQKIREETALLMDKYNDQLTDQKVRYRGQPDTQFSYSRREWFGEGPEISKMVGQYTIVIILLLLVPAINLSGMTLSRMRKRFSEIGVRKAFGASNSELLWQILTENFLITLIGGFVGLIITYSASFLLKDLLFDHASLTPAMMLDPVLFVGAFLFCLLLNLLSAGIPAWRASRTNIVTALTA